MTLTYPALSAARQILWLVTGPAKREALAKLLAGDPLGPGRTRRERRDDRRRRRGRGGPRRMATSGQSAGEFETLLYDVADGVATITLNRPESLNTIVPPMPDEVEAAVERAPSPTRRSR